MIVTKEMKKAAKRRRRTVTSNKAAINLITTHSGANHLNLAKP